MPHLNKGRVMKKERKELVSYVDELISILGEMMHGEVHLDWENLDDEKKSSLCAKFIRYDDSDIFSIYENDEKNEIASYLCNFLENRFGSTNKLIDSLQHKVTSYYAERAQELINERIIYRQGILDGSQM